MHDNTKVQRRYNIGSRREELWIQLRNDSAVMLSFFDMELASFVFEDLLNKDEDFYQENLFAKGFYSEKGVNLFNLCYN